MSGPKLSRANGGRPATLGEVDRVTTRVGQAHLDELEALIEEHELYTGYAGALRLLIEASASQRAKRKARRR